jgi:hypothetical protein
MGNYLRGLGRAVGFSDETNRRSTPGDLDPEWENVSRASSYGDINLLRGATNQGLGPQIAGGDRMIQQGGGGDPQFPNPKKGAPRGGDKGGCREPSAMTMASTSRAELRTGGSSSKGYQKGGGMATKPRGKRWVNKRCLKHKGGELRLGYLP